MDRKVFEEVFEHTMSPIQPGDDAWPKRFIHYTTADAFRKILGAPSRPPSILFSLSSMLNDREEVSIDLLVGRLHTHPDLPTLRDHLASRWPEFWPRFIPFVLDNIQRHKSNVYVFSMCADDEKHHPKGKLSMWRTYGADGKGIAFKVNSEPFKASRMSTNMPVLLFPTRYEGIDQFCKKIIEMSHRFADKIELAKSAGLENACWWLYQTWLLAAATRKHPGFIEEEEWRLLYFPHLDEKRAFHPHIEVSDNGPLRPCFRLEIRDYGPDFGMPNTKLNDLFDCAVIGPNTFDQLAAWRAVAMLLDRASIEKPMEKILLCDTPYRSVG